jgi:hypothetical protein
VRAGRLLHLRPRQGHISAQSEALSSMAHRYTLLSQVFPCVSPRFKTTWGLQWGFLRSGESMSMLGDL